MDRQTQTSMKATRQTHKHVSGTNIQKGEQTTIPFAGILPAMSRTRMRSKNRRNRNRRSKNRRSRKM